MGLILLLLAGGSCVVHWQVEGRWIRLQHQKVLPQRFCEHPDALPVQEILRQLADRGFPLATLLRTEFSRSGDALWVRARVDEGPPVYVKALQVYPAFPYLRRVLADQVGRLFRLAVWSRRWQMLGQMGLLDTVAWMLYPVEEGYGLTLRVRPHIQRSVAGWLQAGTGGASGMFRGIWVNPGGTGREIHVQVNAIASRETRVEASWMDPLGLPPYWRVQASLEGGMRPQEDQAWGGVALGLSSPLPGGMGSVALGYQVEQDSGWWRGSLRYRVPWMDLSGFVLSDQRAGIRCHLRWDTPGWTVTAWVQGGSRLPTTDALPLGGPQGLRGYGEALPRWRTGGLVQTTWRRGMLGVTLDMAFTDAHAGWLWSPGLRLGTRQYGLVLAMPGMDWQDTRLQLDMQVDY